MGSLKQVFVDCQKTTASHPKILKRLVGIYNKSDFDEFVKCFTSFLKKSLIYGDKQPAVERTLNFVSKFATMRKEDQPKEKENTEAEEDKEEEEPEDEADVFLVHLIEFLLNSHEANSQAVRFRVCQLINKILNQMGEEAVIDDELYSSIYDTMLQRLQDKVPTVRVQAVLALARLQDPRNKECPVIKAYRYHLSMDPNSDVRRAVLASTAITFQTLPDVLERTRDVSDGVRREAFKVLSQKVHIRSLTIAQRVRLISEGLKDRSESVRATVEKGLIQSWLRMVNGSVLDFLSCLDVEASVSEAELTLKTLFRDVPFTDLIENFNLDKEERIIEKGALRPESALYWRCLTQHLREGGQEEALDTIIPELTKFCSYVHDYAMAELTDEGDESQEMAVLRMEREFVTMQLITMTMLYDLSDEVGRRSLDKLVRTLLMSDKISDSLVKGLVEVFGKLHPPTTRVNQLAEIISDIREPATKVVVVQPISDEEKRKKKIQAARIKVRMNQLREEIEECAKNLDFEKAQGLKEELEELDTDLSLVTLEEETTEEVQTQEERTDPATLGKCLKIVCHMIENPDITTMTPTLYSLNENLTLSCLRSEDPAVRNEGVKALGLFCLLSADLAKQHLVLFLQICKIDVDQIKLSALHCVIDLLLLYGLEEFTEAAEDINEIKDGSISHDKSTDEDEIDRENEEEGGIIISALCQMMESENLEVRTHAAEGLCKLLLACRITSSKLLSRLIIMWYNPATEDDSLLRHMLGVFFPLYASFGGSNQESLCAAVLPTLHTLFNAPSKSPLADVDVNDVANFLISITNPTFAKAEPNEQVNTHDTLVFSLCTEILAKVDSFWNKILARCLTHLNLTPTNYSTLRQVKVLCDKMLQKVKGHGCQSSLERFSSVVQGYLKNAPEQVIEENEEETADESADNSVFSASTSVIENTIIRKKRMLYNQTHSDLEFFSSEAESDGEKSPMKRTTSDTAKAQELDDISGLGSPKQTSTQKEAEATEASNEKDVEHTIVENTEVELSPIISMGPVTPMKGSQKRSKSQRSPNSNESSSDEEVKTPSKVPRRTRPTAKGPGNHEPAKRLRMPKSVDSQESSESDAIPSKIPRTDSDLQQDENSAEEESSAEDDTEIDITVSFVKSAEESATEETPVRVQEKNGSDESTDDSTFVEKSSRTEIASLPSGSATEETSGSATEETSGSATEKTPVRVEEKNSSKNESTIDSTPVRTSRRKLAATPSGSEIEKSDVSNARRSKRASAQPAEKTPSNRRTTKTSSSSASAEAVEKAPSNRRTTRTSSSSQGTNATPSSQVPSEDSSPLIRKSGRRANTSKASQSSSSSQGTNATPSSQVPSENSSPLVRKSGRRANTSKASQSSSSSSTSTHTSSVSETVTPTRRSGRKMANSQSTDSESEMTPSSGSARRSSRKKGAKK